MASNKRAMASSREEGNDDSDHQVPGKRRYSHSEQSDSRTAAGSSSANDMALSLMEPLFRKVAQEMIPPIIQEVVPPTIQEMIPPILEQVIPSILQRHPSPCCGLSLNRQIGTSGGRALQLCFMNELPSNIFTQSKITAVGGSPLQIALCDATFQHLKVKEDGPSMRIQLCVLDGDFGSNESKDWTAEQFNANILSQRKGKPELLTGDTLVTLKNGVGYVKNIAFTDNSRWTKSGKFRIGVKVWQSTFIGADIIKEGISEPLRVRDNRGEAYKKHDRPSLNDEVWRLQRIAKNGTIYKQLSSNGIETVKHLLQLYTINQASLRQIIGNIARKSWDRIIEHAKACKRDDNERYTYQYFIAGQSISLVFNCIYEVVEVAFNGQDARSLNSLNLEEQHLVEIAKQQAYNNLKDLKPIETTPHSLARTLAAVQYGAPYQGLLQIDLPLIAQQGQPQTWQNLSQPSTSTTLHFDEAADFPHLSQPSTSTTSHFDEAAHSDQVVSSQPPDQLMEMLLNLCEGEQPISGAYIGDEFAGYAVTTTPGKPVDALCLRRDYGAESSTSFPSPAVHISSKGKRKTVWSKIRNVFKWAILYAAKRKAKVFYYHH